MRFTSVLKIWAGIVLVTSSKGQPASQIGGAFSWSGRGGTGGSCVAFTTAVSTSTPRGIRNSRSRSAAATCTSARVAMTSQALPPAGSNAGANAGGSSTTTTGSSTTTAGSKPNKKRTFYRRTLKPPCVAFSSGEGRTLFREALVEGTMESYFRLAEQFRTQDEPAFCGLSTLTMVLNALAVDPGRVWKGPWRWYHESMLDCCAPLEVVKDKGVTLPTMCCLARCNGLNVTVAGPDTHSIEDLRAVVEECSSEDRGKVVVASYDRRGVNQTGTGHFSPIGGYHKAQDVVLIMDTARFKHPPHWIPMDTLWEAMKRMDDETGKPRGFMVLEKAHNLSHRLFTANSTNYKDWPQVASWVNDIVEQATRAPGEKSAGSECQLIAPAADNGSSGMRGLRDATTVAEFVPPLLALLPPIVKGLLTTFNCSEPGRASEGKCQDGEKLLEEEKLHDDSKYQDGVVLQALQGTEVYREITRMERHDRSSSVTSADGIFSADAGRVGGGGGANGPNGGSAKEGPNGGIAKIPDGGTVEGPDACGAKRPDTCCGSVDAQAPPPQQTAAAAVAPFPSPVPSTASPSSPSSFWADEHACGCSSRHVVTIMTYAFLLLLHKRDHEGSCDAGAGAPGDGGGDGDDEGLPEPVWRKDPLGPLPTPVADEAKHVAGMLRGLVEMERCEKCTQS